MLVKMDNVGYVKIDEDTGEDLRVEDIAEGYVDCIYYDVYKTYSDLQNDNSYIGCTYMLKEKSQDMFTSAKDVVDYLINHNELPNYDYVFIEL